MFISKEAVSILFRLINFFILSGLIVYVFRNYLLTPIKEKLADKWAFFRNLEDQHKNLVDQKNILDIEIKDQDKLFELLKDKIAIWKQACQRDKEARESQMARIKKNHINRVTIQNENLYQQTLLDKVAPSVIKGTYVQLEKTFEDKKKSQKFLGDIIEYMEKSS